MEELDFLGHRVMTEGILPMPERVQPIVDFQPPTCKVKLQRFIGMITYYARFLPSIACILVPLHEAVGIKTKEKRAPIAWTTKCQLAFIEAKAGLASATLLHHPSPSEETRLTTDASGVAVGGKLEQEVKGGWALVAFFSKN